jgi:hypothetical protein
LSQAEQDLAASEQRFRLLELLAGGLHEGTARWSKAAIGLPLSLRA